MLSIDAIERIKYDNLHLLFYIFQNGYMTPKVYLETQCWGKLRENVDKRNTKNNVNLLTVNLPK